MRKIGRNQLPLVEPPDAIKVVLVRWNGVKNDLAKLAKLRWIEKLSTPEICQIVGKRRSSVRTSLRTIRKCGIGDLNLTVCEKKRVLEGMSEEQQKYGGQYR